MEIIQSKKIVAMLIILVMIIGICSSAFADELPPLLVSEISEETAEIEVNEEIPGIMQKLKQKVLTRDFFKKLLNKIKNVLSKIFDFFKDLLKVDEEEKPDEELKVLVEFGYYNYAWVATHNIEAILSDGTIVDFRPLDHKEEYNKAKSLEDISKVIMKYGVKKEEKISDKDLELLKEYIENLEVVDFEKKNWMCDYGEKYIDVYDYKNSKINCIYEYGDCTGYNETENSLEIIKIINKYTDLSIKF